MFESDLSDFFSKAAAREIEAAFVRHAVPGWLSGWVVHHASRGTLDDFATTPHDLPALVSWPAHKIGVWIDFDGDEKTWAGQWIIRLFQNDIETVSVSFCCDKNSELTSRPLPSGRWVIDPLGCARLLPPGHLCRMTRENEIRERNERRKKITGGSGTGGTSRGRAGAASGPRPHPVKMRP